MLLLLRSATEEKYKEMKRFRGGWVGWFRSSPTVQSIPRWTKQIQKKILVRIKLYLHRKLGVLPLVYYLEIPFARHLCGTSPAALNHCSCHCSIETLTITCCGSFTMDFGSDIDQYRQQSWYGSTLSICYLIWYRGTAMDFQQCGWHVHAIVASLVCQNMILLCGHSANGSPIPL